MKTIIIVLAIFSFVAAVPTMRNKLKFRNLYVEPSGSIEHHPEPRIIGGKEAKKHSIPYQAFLEVYTYHAGWYCGGVLLSENYVLTAGHCGDGGVLAHITLGAHKVLTSEKTQQTFSTYGIKVHEDYDKDNIRNDLTIMRFEEPAVLNEYVQPVSLPKKTDANNTYEGKNAKVSGWGLTDGEGEDLSEALNALEVPVISNEECSKAFDIVQPSNICTSGSKGTGACSGDSGCPLTVDGTLVGIVSFGANFCESGYPTAFARVTSFLDWIEKNSDVKLQ